MTINDYLKTFQPAIYQTFVNAKNTNTLSHAYLLVGPQGTPLKETALFLAKSLLCDNPNPLADEMCLTCHRVDNNAYSDFYFIDGSKESIKKDAVLGIEKAFSVTSVEKKGLLIYIIHLAENMTIEAINSLLKFLEEPTRNVYAFLTTENESAVLPTIISRSQTLKLKLINRETLLSLCEPYDITPIDQQLLSCFYNLPESIKVASENNDYLLVKKVLDELLVSLGSSLEEGYLTATLLIPTLKEKYLIKQLLTFLALFWKDVVNYKVGTPLLFPSFEEKIAVLASKISNPLPLIIKTYTAIDKLNANVNLGLLLDELFIFVIKEGNYGQ